MKVMTPDEGWGWLVKKTRRAPLCAGLTALGSDVGDTVIRQGLGPRLVGIVFFLGAAVVCFALSFKVGYVFGGISVLLAALVALGRFRVSLDAYRGVLTVVRGMAGLERLVSLPRDKLELTRALIGADADGGDSRPAGRHMLQLTHVERPGVVYMMILPEEPELPPVARALTEFFAGRVVEAADTCTELADGSPLSIPKAPTATTCWTAEMELKFPAPGRAVLAARFPGKLLRSMLGMPCAVVLALGVGTFFQPGLLALAIYSALFVVGAGVVMYLLLAALLPPRIVADLEEDVLYVEGFRRRRKRQWSLADVAGVQLCAFHVNEAPPGMLAYEANVVLRKDAARVRMWSSDDRDRAARDARRFAEFIGKPFWDHT